MFTDSSRSLVKFAFSMNPAFVFAVARERAATAAACWSSGVPFT